MSEKTTRLASVMRLVQGDAEREGLGTDGFPFNGRTVGTQFGNIAAEIKALAMAVEVLCGEIEGLERTLASRTEHLV